MAGSDRNSWRWHAAVVAAGVLAILAGCSGPIAGTEPQSIDSTVNVSVEAGEAADCVLVIDADVADDEVLTAIQEDAAGLADSVTMRQSANITRSAYQGANVTVYAVNPETENTSTLFRGTTSSVLADECGIKTEAGD